MIKLLSSALLVFCIVGCSTANRKEYISKAPEFTIYIDENSNVHADKGIFTLDEFNKMFDKYYSEVKNKVVIHVNYHARQGIVRDVQSIVSDKVGLNYITHSYPKGAIPEGMKSIKIISGRK
jgi:hypothetical protein